MISTLCGRLAPALFALAAALPAHAQDLPPPPAAGQSRVCVQLEGQLASLDRGANDPSRAEQARRQEEAVNKQQFEYDRARSQQRQAGCEGTGFFLFGQPPQCAPLNTRVQQTRAALERAQAELDQLQGGAGPEREGQRRGILAALAQHNCGPQYRTAAAQQQPRGFFETLFGPGSVLAPIMPDGAWSGSGSGTYRTVCVRLCDGYYYPISFSAAPGRFSEDARVCQRSCPAAEVALYSHRNPGEDMNQAMSVSSQQPYTALPTAFAYRRAFDSSCSCKRPGESWAQALKHLDDQTVERGDIVVNEERARQMSQPRIDAQGRPIRPEPRSARPDLRAPARPPAAATAEATSPEGSAEPDPKRSVRTVGPTFYSR